MFLQSLINMILTEVVLHNRLLEFLTSLSSSSANCRHSTEPNDSNGRCRIDGDNIRPSLEALIRQVVSECAFQPPLLIIMMFQMNLTMKSAASLVFLFLDQKQKENQKD
ncbi:hypothetical protein PanWU01x14_163970 [Parasponia andersonii]|uniref:Uncharacterized protein n=1 Tax=Parasponia andersonii TaxID=3476 RepID=A0A2P5CCV4_PARAD|nr:hypothetical protein PanWU01x14_163970 [Parasponia andersonii]